MRVFLTKRAVDLEHELMAVAEEVNHTMLHALSSKDEKQVTNNLRSIRKQLSTSSEGTEMVDD